MSQEYYVVSLVEDDGATDNNIVIKAGTKAQVRQHILAKYTITPASKEMLVDLLTAGCKVEQVAEEDASPSPAGEKQA